MMQAVIIHGPQGCGKTRHAKDFCELYGCTAWTYDWLPGEPLVPGLLHLTFEVPSGLPGRDVQIISFDEAMKALGEKIVVRHHGRSVGVRIFLRAFEKTRLRFHVARETRLRGQKRDAPMAEAEKIAGGVPTTGTVVEVGPG